MTKDLSNTIKEHKPKPKIVTNILKYVFLAIYILVFVYFIEHLGLYGIWWFILLTIIMGLLIIIINWSTYKNIVDYGTLVIKNSRGELENVKRKSNRKIK